MASIRNLKKDINFVLGDIIEAVYIVDAANGHTNSKEGSKIVDNAIEIFDALIVKVNKKDVDNRKAHLNEVRSELEVKAKDLVTQVNELN